VAEALRGQRADCLRGLARRLREVAGAAGARHAETCSWSTSSRARAWRVGRIEDAGPLRPGSPAAAAADALVSTQHSIEEIAQSCGFANRYHFTRVFSQRMGCPPARYRSDRPYTIQPRGPGGPERATERGSIPRVN
jgi:hypothetical protein